MTKTQFQQLKKQLEKLLQKAEDEALEEGIDVSSSEFEEVILLLKKKVLHK